LVPGRQVSLKQQPWAQVAGPHGLGLHCPAWHCSAAAQVMQVWPLVPQALSEGFCLHWPPSQHPVQLLGPQGSLVQAPLTQRSSDAQATQAPPLIPHVAWDETDVVTATQVPVASTQPTQLSSSPPQAETAMASMPNPTNTSGCLIVSSPAS